MVTFRWMSFVFYYVLLIEASPVFAASRCCNNPTVWTFKNLDKYPVQLICRLERSVAWAGDPIIVKTEIIKPGSVYRHTWDANYYAEGVGMLPGSWSCKSLDTKLSKSHKTIKFVTTWGENRSIHWRTASVAGRNRRDFDRRNKSLK